MPSLNYYFCETFELIYKGKGALGHIKKSPDFLGDFFTNLLIGQKGVGRSV